jgi:hypothetical protein
MYLNTRGTKKDIKGYIKLFCDKWTKDKLRRIN